MSSPLFEASDSLDRQSIQLEKQGSGSADPFHLDSSGRLGEHLEDSGPIPKEHRYSPVPNDERSATYDIDSGNVYGSSTGVDVYMANSNPASSLPGPSTASLMGTDHFEQDEAHLTARISHSRTVEGGYTNSDPEHDGGATRRSRDSRRRTKRYSSTPSQLDSAMDSVTNNVRRISLRVVNFANHGLEDHLRLEDDDETRKGKKFAGAEEHRDLPIRGRTLGFLGTYSRVRLALFNFLVHPFTEPFILLLIMVDAVVLTIQSFPALTLSTANGPTSPPHVKGFFQSWEDYVLFALFIVFTIEAAARICVTGFLFDPEMSIFALFSTSFSHQSKRYIPTTSPQTFSQRLDRLLRKVSRPFALASDPPVSAYPMTTAASTDNLMYLEGAATTRVASPSGDPSEQGNNSVALRSENSASNPALVSLPFRLNIVHLQDQTERNVPYLRQSWSRLDFIAIVSFWICFLLASIGVERGRYHVGVFRALSVMRTARLLSVTTGTTIIMRSLKIARPLLTSVAYFCLFAAALFSIIGVQSFNGSLRRICVIQPTLGETQHLRTGQLCGGHIDPFSLQRTGFLRNNHTAEAAKGYICPLGQVCMELDNPKSNLESFDAIHYSVLQVIIVAAGNGWAPIMYNMMDADFAVSCLFFIIIVIVLNFWLLNLFVAVITNSFAAIRSVTNESAFGASLVKPIDKDQDEEWPTVDGRKAATRSNLMKTIYGYTKWVWILLALFSLVLQATRTVDVSPRHEALMFYGEIAITIAFDFEIILRFCATLPDWRSFFQHGSNWLDTTIAIGSSIIQIPVIRNSSLYRWFTIFQLARFYRVILVVPRMKPLLLAVFGNISGLANMALFLIMVNYISALVAVQLLRGDFRDDENVNFGELFNSFLAMYQIFSIENWTDVMYNAAVAEIPLGQSFIVIVFICAWMFFSNFIMLQMFIAVINENFDVAEEQKKAMQVHDYYVHEKERSGTAVTWLRYLNPYRWLKPHPETLKVNALPSDLVLVQKTVVQESSKSNTGQVEPSSEPVVTSTKPLRKNRFARPRRYSTKSLTALQELFAGETKDNEIPLTTFEQNRSGAILDALAEETERHLLVLAAINPDVAIDDGAEEGHYERRAQKADFIRDHPTYDRVFWVIGQKNWVRRMCQKLVQPARGERIFGTPPSPVAHPIFQLFLLLTVIGGIVVEAIATPIYRRDYYARFGQIRGSWFEIAEASFGFALLLEFMIKVIADGFIFTPNGYLRSKWNCFDFVIMIGSIVNVMTSLIFIGGLSRFTRSLKALRALRLITLIDKMRNTFHNLLISGALRIMDAAILAVLYMIPYAVWGLNIFQGRLNACSDTSANGISDCTGEYVKTIYDQAFGFPVPRVWDNPSPSTTFSFDSFFSSFLILFEIVSLEGWIDVMHVAMSMTGPGLQPKTNVSEGNAIFFLIYDLTGGVVILTLFVSIIIGNFSSRTGSALLTNAQREWIDLKKLIKRQRPSKRPKVQPTGPFRKWCFDRAVSKHGWWTNVLTMVFVFHIITLMTQTFSMGTRAETIRYDFFLVFICIYLIDVFVRCYGLGWRSFRSNGWNLFDIVVSIGSFVTILIVLFGKSGFAIQQLQKLFLVSIAFKLVQRSNSLNTLFKAAISSLPVILSLLGLWLTLFMFFAILYVEVFGLTKWGGVETPTTNYASFGSALLMLAFQSTGEFWNLYMHDYDLTYPRCTNGSNELDSDCGSTAWAFALFIIWNILSMYIFLNLFTGVVVENFSYVFQASGGFRSISREQMRSFKKIWGEFANQQTGYLEQNRFAAFFAKLSGVFEVRIYPAEYNIRNILNLSKDPSDQETWHSRVVDGVDITKLEPFVNSIDYAEVQKRKAIYCRLYHEASISHEPGIGISFTNMLTLIAHYTLIVDDEALTLQDLVIRTEKKELVTELVNLDRIRSSMKTMFCRRRFLDHLKKKRTQKDESQSSSTPLSIPMDSAMSSPSAIETKN